MDENDGEPRKRVKCAAACGACGEGPAPHRCSRCKKVSYCDASCQAAHWAAHKPRCAAPAAPEPDGAPPAPRARPPPRSCGGCGGDLDERGYEWRGCCGAIVCASHEPAAPCASCGAAAVPAAVAWTAALARARGGDSEAAFVLGVARETGAFRGYAVDVDGSAAVALYAAAAARGHVDAAYRCACCLDGTSHLGDAVERDEARALGYYCASALSGDSHAQYEYAGCLRAGTLGCGIDLDRARLFLGAAADQGHPRCWNQSRGKTAGPGYLPTPLSRPNRTRFP